MNTFSLIRKMFGGDSSMSQEDQAKLYEELLFLTLSRASRSDLDISSIEVSKIQQIIKRETGFEASEQDIRTSGMSELYETAPLEKYVTEAARNLSTAQRQNILSALFELINVDDKVSLTEANFVNTIADALNLQPVQLLGATIDGVDD